MSDKAYDHFSFELRQFRLANDISRAAFASILGISASTLKQWEDGTTQARTYKLWEVYDRLKVFEFQDKNSAFETGHLMAVFEELIDNLKLANINDRQIETSEIQKKLTKTILKAAQTDFGLSSDRSLIVPVPFTEDLELFRQNRILDIEQLLQSIVSNIGDTLPHIEKSNLNSQRLIETFFVYVEEANRDIPNPRILHRKGEILRRQILNGDVRSALSDWDIAALEGFVDDHQELMKLYFGEALLNSQEVERANINRNIVDRAAHLARKATQAFEELNQPQTSKIRVDARVSAILHEIAREVSDYEVGLREANTPSAQRDAEQKILTSVKHIAIYIGRFLLRAASFTRQAGLDTVTAAASLEVLSPGAIKDVYEAIRVSFPSLPPLL